MASYKLAVAAVIVAPLTFTMNDAGVVKNFEFKLQFDRISEDEWQARVKNDKGLIEGARIKRTLAALTRNWDGQTLILDEETGAPAAFCREACDALYEVPGFTDVAMQAFLREVGARVKT